MNSGVLFSLLIAHVLADFILQSSGMVIRRCSNDSHERIISNSYHTLIYGVLSFSSTIYNNLSFYPILITLILVLFHGFIDYQKGKIIANKPIMKYSIGLFLVDQFIHLISIFVAAYFISKKLHKLTQIQYALHRIIDLLQATIKNASPMESILIVIFLLLIGIWGVGIFIQILTNSIKYHGFSKILPLEFSVSENSNDNGVSRGGYIIGILERLIIISSVVSGQYTVIGFLVAIKSIARFKKLDDEKFAEYFIIGSFSSIFSAIIIGLLIKKLMVGI